MVGDLRSEEEQQGTELLFRTCLIPQGSAGESRDPLGDQNGRKEGGTGLSLALFHHLTVLPE